MLIVSCVIVFYVIAVVIDMLVVLVRTVDVLGTFVAVCVVVGHVDIVYIDVSVFSDVDISIH